MLGLADRDKMLILFKKILEGNEQQALAEVKGMIANGIDTKIF